MFGRLGGTLSDVLEKMLQRRSKKHSENHSMVVKTVPAQTLDKNMCKQQSGDLSWTELSSACILTCVPLLGCCFGDTPAREVMKINLSAF